jgi:hypothetical protein
MAKNKIRIVTLILVFAFLFSSCSVFNALKSISQLKYKLGTVGNFQLSGITITSKSKLSDFSPTDLLKLTGAVANGKLPVTFILNVEAYNPNTQDGLNRSTVSLSNFPWRLLIDDKETISGNINAPVTVPGGNQTTIIPLQMQLDLFQFFGDRGYERLINLALKLGGQGGSATDIKLIAKPSISTEYGNMTYPGELTIISKEFR